MSEIASSIFEAILCVVLIFGPIIGYIPQYRQIHRTQESFGFSTLVCFILIAANILRVFFWVLKRFEMTLLFQSLVMIVAQLILLELIVRINLRHKPHIDERRNYQISQGFDMNRFWSWDYFGEYLAFLAIFVFAIGILTIINQTVLGSEWVTEGVGFMALMTEATLAFPQLWQNYQNKSCRGLSSTLVLTWFAGDAFKTAFFLWRHSPVQFVACGIIQLIADIGIAMQMQIYPSSSITSKRSPLIGGPAHLQDLDTHQSPTGGEEFEEFVLLKKMSSRAGVFGDSQQLEATSVYQAADS